MLKFAQSPWYPLLLASACSFEPWCLHRRALSSPGAFTLPGALPLATAMAPKVHKKTGPKLGSKSDSKLSRGDGGANFKEANDRRQTAALNKPGAFYLCDICCYPRRVPHSAKGSYRCALPPLKLSSGTKVTCSFSNSARQWRSKKAVPGDAVPTRRQHVEAAVRDAYARVEAGTLERIRVWSAVVAAVRAIPAPAAPEPAPALAPGDDGALPAAAPIDP